MVFMQQFLAGSLALVTAFGPLDTVPDFTGKSVKEVETAWKKPVKSIDATGQNRLVVSPSNWQVCSQEPAAATEFAPGKKPQLTVKVVKKVGETCP
ncbi:PASTA domain-containing protein [Pseudonocardiaceae bacterium YIM PH 21723]|nr:PASTA domain-containing protein [Pseudonocardiaceae bacterium YIM PH 21723]